MYIFEVDGRFQVNLVAGRFYHRDFFYYYLFYKDFIIGVSTTFYFIFSFNSSSRQSLPFVFDFVLSFYSFLYFLSSG